MIPKYEVIKDAPLLYWTYQYEEKTYYLSSKLAGILHTKELLQEEEFKRILSNEYVQKLEAIKQIGTQNTLEWSFQLETGESLYLQHNFQKTEDSLIAWCSTPLKTSLHSILEELDRHTMLLQSLQNVQSKLWSKKDFKHAFDTLLSYLLKITDSEYGFMGEIKHTEEENAPFLKTHAITNIAWNDETRQFYYEHAPKGMEFHNLDTLFGHAIRYEEVVIANEPKQDNRSGGLPKGHPEMRAFLGLPVPYQDEMIGMVGIANKPGGYDENIVKFLQPFLLTYGTLIKNLKLQKEQQEFQDKIILAKSKVEHALEIQARILKNISHELRTPLSLIIGPLNTIIGRTPKNYSRSELELQLKHIKKNAVQLNKVVDNILDISNYNTGQDDEAQLEPKGLYNLVKEIFKQFEEDAKIKQQNYQLVYLADQDLICLLDASKVKRILSHLISNAIKFTPSYGAITLTLKIWKELIQIEVRDTGIGLKKDELERIFDPHHQIESTILDEVNTGLGMGLALSKKLVAVLSGNIEVISKYGMGSSFIFSFPFQESELAALETTEVIEDTTALFSPPKEKIHILVAEDNADMRDFINNILAPHFELQLTKNGKAAYHALEKEDQTFDLIITDLMMPIMGGLELLQNVRSHHKLKHIPAIVLTAISEEKTKLDLISTGINDYIIKPFISDELLASIQNCLVQQKNKKALANPNELKNTEADLNWIKMLRKEVLANLDDLHFTLTTLAKKLYVSERQLYREVQRITGMTPLSFIKEVRLQQARILLETGKHDSLVKISYATGFSTTSYFSKIYEKRFGKKPSSYFNSPT